MLDVRIKLKLDFQKRLFKKLSKNVGGTKKLAKLFAVSTSTIKRYKNGKIRYISYGLLLKVLKFLKIKLDIQPFILEKVSLKDVRRRYIKKATKGLKNKYGSDYLYILASNGWKGLEEKYGKNWPSVIGKRGFKTSEIKYGKDYHKILWDKAIKSLEQRYGKNWGKIIWNKSLDSLKRKYGNKWYDVVLPNAWKALENKFGKNWASILSKFGAKSLEKKYGKEYHKYLYELSNLHEHRLLTKTESLFANMLKEKVISFETHKIIKNMEYDIVIPSSKKPKIACEITNQVPSINNLRRKIAHLLLQKETFPNATHFLIANLSKANKKGENFNFSSDVFCYLREKGITVIDIKDMNKGAEFIYKLYNDRQINEITEYLDIIENKLKTQKFFNTSHAASIGSFLNKPTSGERSLHKNLCKINANPLGLQF